MNDLPMPKEGFLRRWARLKAKPGLAPSGAARPIDDAPQPIVHCAAPPAVPASAPERQAPTLEAVARLTPQSDYSAFVAGGVDPAVRRLALKKLFADPSFAVMDGLDIYIDDYTKASPLTDAMLASLRHAPGVLTRLLGKNDESGQAAGHDMNPDTAPAAPAAPAGVPSQYPARPAATAHSPGDPALEVDVLPVAHVSMPQGRGPSPQAPKGSA